MDYNSYVFFTLMLLGRYDFYNKKVHISQTRKAINRFLIFVNVFCGLKAALILFIPHRDAIFYLIELYIAEGYAQTSFTFAIISVHLATGYSYYYWSYLNSDVNRMQCLKFLFIPNINDLCNCYNLDLKLTKNYLKKAKKIVYFIIILIFAFEIGFFTFVGRCYYLSFFKVNLIVFIFVSTPCTLMTFITSHCVVFGLLTTYGFLFTTMDFLALRAQNVSRKILNFKFKKGNTDEFELIKEINSIVLQFKDANDFFDSCITFVYLNVLMAAFLFPVFLFMDISFLLKILTIFLYIIGLFFAGYTNFIILLV